jgi:light-regulated signal transduction histidine kinase (bacteriophytochrome)
LRDITARKRSEARIARLNAELEQRVGRRTAQLEASNRDLQEFAHSVAHDLRQPFIAIGGFSGLLERRVTDDRARHYINRIKAGVRQAGELTEALLALANLSRVQLRVQAVDLSAVAHSVMDALQQEEPARARSICIQEGLLVQADAMLLRLVMQELLGNAWKFTSRQKHTEISFGLQPAPAAGTEAVYVVSDNGEGFDMAHVDKLFRSFQRLHAPQDFPGAGVGLANIQRIIARHGGQIWAESARGEGARFFFTLGSPGA